MSYNKFIYASLFTVFIFSSCTDENMIPGNPAINLGNEVEADAFFGDSLSFTVNVADNEVPLSTLKAQLYYGEDMVSETVLRTKVSGQDYTGKIYIPYYPNVKDGTATLKYVLQNINFTTTEKEQDLALKRPDFPYLTLVTEDVEYRMERVGLYQYEVENKFPQKVKGYIKAPKYGENGNEISFGWTSEGITHGSTTEINFSNEKAGKYAISFNTLTYEAAPFVQLKLDGKEMIMVDNNNYYVTGTFSKGQILAVEGIPNLDEWYIDPDFFKLTDNGELEFQSAVGEYKITASFQFNCFIVDAIAGDADTYPEFQEDGTGMLWVKGNDLGKPSFSSNPIGFGEKNSLCMSKVSDKVYQITLVAGENIKTDKIDFKFFYCKNRWGGELKDGRLTTNSDLVFVGEGKDVNGADNGNLALKEGVTLEANGIYVFTVDASAGRENSVLTVEYKGQQPVKPKKIFIGESQMEMQSSDIYTLEASFTQNQKLSLTGFNNLDEWYWDPDYFKLDAENETVTFLPVDGQYKLTANITSKLMSAERTDIVTLDDDCHGTLWIMGWGLGSPSLKSQFGWTPGQAHAMAEISPKVYQFTGVAGPETSSEYGTRIRMDYLSFKFFHQDGWGGETASSLTEGGKTLLTEKGNLELAEEVTLEEGATYVITVDFTNGKENATIDMRKL